MQRELQAVWSVSPAELLVLLSCARGMAQRAHGPAGGRTFGHHARGGDFRDSGFIAIPTLPVREPANYVPAD